MGTCNSQQIIKDNLSESHIDSLKRCKKKLSTTTFDPLPNLLKKKKRQESGDICESKNNYESDQSESSVIRSSNKSFNNKEAIFEPNAPKTPEFRLSKLKKLNELNKGKTKENRRIRHANTISKYRSNSTVKVSKEILNSLNRASGSSTTKSIKSKETKSRRTVNQSDISLVGASNIALLSRRRQTRRQGITFTFDFTSQVSKNFEEVILEECKKDKMNINLGRCFEIICQNKNYLKLDKAIDEYTNANCVHYCCILGHSELLQKIIEINPSLALVKDEFGNTPLHYLCQNTVSKFKEIKDMWECLKRNGAKQLAKNKQGLSCLDILDKRIKAANPYDEMAKYLKIVKE